MLSRLGPVILVLSLLLVSIPVEAQLQIQPTRDLVVRQNATSSLKDVAIIWLYVVREGRLEKLNFTADEPATMTRIKVDGYVNGVVVLSKLPMTISVNQKPMNAIRINADGYFKIKHFGQIEPQAFWSTYMPAAYEHISTEQVQGRYASFAKVPWDTLSKTREFEITFDRNGTQQALTIRQDTPVKLAACNLPAANAGESEFYYLGKDPSQFEQTATDFKDRVHAIQKGIRAVEVITDSKIVEAVHIIDCDGPRNAYTCQDKAEIWLYSRLFWNESLSELRAIAEHEAMHILSDRLELPANSRIRAQFAELMNFETLSRERLFVMTTGHPPVGRTATKNASKASRLFDFINEINFIRGMSGGHSQDSVDEFCASFLHTLIYIDRLGPLLGQPVIARDGSLLVLSFVEQVQLLKEYHGVLKTIVNEISPLKQPPGLTALFQAGLATTHQVGISFEDQRANTIDPKSRRNS